MGLLYDENSPEPSRVTYKPSRVTYKPSGVTKKPGRVLINLVESFINLFV